MKNESFPNWDTNEPTNADCGMIVNGKWYTKTCSHRYFMICQFSGTEEMFNASIICLVNFVGSVYFHLYRVKSTWYEARDYCKNRGGQLAKIRNSVQNSEIHSFSRSNWAWISVNDLDVS